MQPHDTSRHSSSLGLRADTALVIALLVGAIVPSTASATPPDTYGFGARARALGGAVTADVSDSSASYHNPAGLAAAEGIQLSIGYLSLSPFLDVNGERSNVERFGSLEVGMIAPVKLGDVTVAFGLALMLPDQRLARTRSTILNRPRWEMYDTRSQRLFLAANLAIRPVRWLTIGAGIAFQAPSELTLDIRGDLALANPEANSRLEHQFKGDLTSIRYPAVGFQIRPNDWVSFGMTYRGQYELANRIIALADVRVARIADLTFGLDTLSTSLFGPQQIATSFAVHPMPNVRIGLELLWMNWSAHPSLIPAEDITLGLEPAIVELPGNIEGRVAVPLGLRDVFVPRIGVEWTAIRTHAIELDLRAGYYYEKTPFPLQRGIMNFVDGDEHSASIGFGLRLTDLRPTLPGALAINGYLQWSHIVSRTHVKDSLVDPVGDYRAGGNLLGAGVQLEVAFQ
ncbi:MAG: outer membrane protein transport protein [Myxococcales bacterium]|nr:outer membrane protein transport protein [Myxococcales bacterium]